MSLCVLLKKTGGLWLLALCTVCTMACVSAAPVTKVKTEYGWIEGDYEAEKKLTGYYGIPFATPPLRELRFSSPVPPQPWNGTKSCKVDKFFKSCLQFSTNDHLLYGSEDCLYMNIYVPDDATEPLPVMFWIYGGGFNVGDGYEFGWYRGKNLAAKHNVIVVEHNYRIGSLGFLAHDALKNESAQGTTGNYGTQDQLMALKFVHDNIAQFGGDPSRVTIFGESAGAMSVCWHLVNEASQGLFSSAIMESGTCSSAEFFVTYDRATEFSQGLINHVKCNGSDPISCLRETNPRDLMMDGNDYQKINRTIPPLAPVMPWGPVIDMSSMGLKARPIDSIRAGNFAQVPIIMGTNHDEGTLFVEPMKNVVPGVKIPLNDADADKVLAHFFNATTVTAVNTQYPKGNFKDQDDRLATVLRDFFFLCPTRDALLTINKFNVSTYMYQFNYEMSNWIDYDLLGDYHTSELSFVFDNEWPPIVHTFGPKERRMSDVFTSYWTNMARFGAPNYNLNKDQQNWPVFEESKELSMNMIVPVKVDAKLATDLCQFWKTHYPKYQFA
eukprot:m.182680 g.182680  ORF g.182680 m.182680 type:complete len:554 (+) comp14674_c0_seq3:190-1851(+)